MDKAARLCLPSRIDLKQQYRRGMASLSCPIERLSITFTANGKRLFKPRDEVSPLLVIHCSLFLHIN